MNMPGFNADASLTRRAGQFRSRQSRGAKAQAVVPAIPACANCPGILDRCERNGWRPKGLCNLCAFHNCYDPNQEEL